MSDQTSGTDCFVCDKHRVRGLLIPGGPVAEDDLVMVSHLTPVAHGGDDNPVYLGHLFVEPLRHAPGLADLTDAEAERARGTASARTPDREVSRHPARVLVAASQGVAGRPSRRHPRDHSSRPRSTRPPNRGIGSASVRILVLGGTSFVGRAIVDDALKTGADVTLFSRGKTGAGLFPELTHLVGDRDTGDYSALRDGDWDGVVDVSGYLPRHVSQAMDALAHRVGRYVFISSHAVYRRDVGPGVTEDAPRRRPVRDVRATEDLDDETYGPSKVACEDDVTARFGERSTIVRPGKVAGPHDPSDMFTYWVRRTSQGGRVALPGDPRQPVQVIDSRDLAGLVVRLLADDRPGAFHAVGPAEPVTLGGLIRTCALVAGTEVEIVPVPPESATPLFPLIRPNWASQQRDPARAHAAGMPATPLEVTAADVLAWDRDRGEPPLSRGFSAEQEQALIERHSESNPADGLAS